jgi:hypothetical protein
MLAGDGREAMGQTEHCQPLWFAFFAPGKKPIQLSGPKLADRNTPVPASNLALDRCLARIELLNQSVSMNFQSAAVLSRAANVLPLIDQN